MSRGRHTVLSHHGRRGNLSPRAGGPKKGGDGVGRVRIWAVIAAGAVFMSVAGGAWAASGGDANAGDVWVDNVGEPAGPGHEMDPHLACQDINLWGSGLTAASGAFTIDGCAASG